MDLKKDYTQNDQMKGQETRLNSMRPNKTQQELEQLNAARQAYIKQMQNAILGKQSAMFKSRLPIQIPVYNAFQSSVGIPIYEMGVGNQPNQTPEQKAMEDQLGAQLFRFPTTDPLAYHRRIEAPHVFRASPVFGF